MHFIIKIIGWTLIVLGLAHFYFPRHFKWNDELKRLSLLNRQIMSVHNFFIMLTVLLMGLLCVTSTELLLTTELGKRMMLGLAIFWGCRFFIQFFWYSPELWKGKRFETIVHLCFSCFWLLLTVVFAYGSLNP